MYTIVGIHAFITCYMRVPEEWLRLVRRGLRAACPKEPYRSLIGYIDDYFIVVYIIDYILNDYLLAFTLVSGSVLARPHHTYPPSPYSPKYTYGARWQAERTEIMKVL